MVHCVVDESSCAGNGVTADWAVIRLDRAVTGRTPVFIEPAVASVGTNVYIVGHPSGLPRKYTAKNAASVLDMYGGSIGSAANVRNIVTNLDSFRECRRPQAPMRAAKIFTHVCHGMLAEGNSGSGVFASDTHKMVGIIITGGEDWQVTGGCTQAHTCPMGLTGAAGCPGEEATSAMGYSIIKKTRK